MHIPRSEYPRPQFRRENWYCLNGEWDFSFETDSFDRKIIVPYACETALSGIGDRGFHPIVWYRKRFCLPEAMVGKQILLHFGAVDDSCDLWVNGQYVRSHIGGQTGFSADITRQVSENGENEIVLKVLDDPEDLEMPRGKQYWKLNSESIFYSRTTGIWQSVWLDAVEALHLKRCRITPEYDDCVVRFDFSLSAKAAELAFEITFQGKIAAAVQIVPEGEKGSISVPLEGVDAARCAWTPETPRLFDVTIRVYGQKGLTDRVESYFGLRKISLENGKFLLNNREYYQKLVLDQGYWEPSLMTAPTDADFVRDIELTKAMGFNGVRKHQKVEDPRYLYHADHMGLLVWGEIGAAHRYSAEYARRMYAEWLDAVERDYNHPCIVAWVPLNESWGVRSLATDETQQAHCKALLNMTKSVDPTRPVLDNDGWEHTCGDLLTIHDYTASGEVLEKRYADMESILATRPEGRSLFAREYTYLGQPVLVTEFGGIKYAPESAAEGSWGYCETADAAAYTAKLAELIRALLTSPVLQGYCYTQLTDIELEENGLLTYGREPKIPLDTVRRINAGTWGEK